MSSSIPNIPGIYKITCIPTGKVYVGSALNLRTRWNAHQSMLRRKIHSNVYLQRAWNKHGKDAFAFAVIEQCDIEQLRIREQFHINYHQSCSPKGFNLRRYAAAKGITRQPYRQRHLFVTVVHRDSPERSAKRSQVWRGRKHRPESIEKMRAAKIGKPEHPNAARAKVEAKAKWYIVTDPDGNEYTIKNLSAFCREHDLTGTSMCRLIRGKAKQHKGWKCRRK